MGTTTNNCDKVALGHKSATGLATGLLLPSSAPALENAGSVDKCTPSFFSTAENPFLFPLDLLLAESTSPTGDFDANSPAIAANPSLELQADENDESIWWLLHTKPRQEKKLAEQLARLELPHYLPVTKHTALTRGRPRVTRAPLFPGYFFLKGTPDQRLRALETNRLVATHRVDDGKSLSQRLWELADLIQQGVPLTAEARLAPGKKVRVKSGAFQNMEGTVIRRGGKTRLFILVNQLMGGVSLEIEEHLLEPLI